MNPLFERYKKDIDTRIIALCNRTNGSNVPWAEDIAKRLADFSIRGKSIRGSLFLLSVELFDLTRRESALQIAVAIEILHSALLIHDDIIDHDRLRRGIPSIHTQYETVGKEQKITNAPEFGEAMAICVGDIAIFGGFSYLSSLNLEPELYKEIINTITEEFLTVGFGEIDDVAMGYMPTLPTKEQVLSMYTRKTARYTFSLPLKLGAVLTGQSKEIQATLYEIGENLGRMFQLQDDLLTLTGIEEKVGKTIGNDISENKKTYPTIVLFERCTDDEKKLLHSLYGNKALTSEEISSVLTLLRKYDVLLEVTNLINEYTTKATDRIKDLNLSSEKLEKVQRAITFITQRTK